MTTDVKLLPLYAELQGHPKLEIIKHYARANMEPLLAENERLRAEAAKRDGIDPWAVLLRAQEAESRAERLAEALRFARERFARHMDDSDRAAFDAALNQESSNE